MKKLGLVLSIFLLVSCSAFFREDIKDSKSNIFAELFEYIPGGDKMSPFAVRNLKSVSIESATSVSLKWKTPAGVGFVEVFRTEDLDKGFEKVSGKLSVNANEYEDWGLKAGTSYYYQVHSYGFAGKDIGSSVIILVTTEAVPYNIKGFATSTEEGNDGRIYISFDWNSEKFPGYKFNVYRSDVGEKIYTIVSSEENITTFIAPNYSDEMKLDFGSDTLDNSFTDYEDDYFIFKDNIDENDIGKHYFYYIRSVYDGKENPRSKIIEKWTTKVGAPEPPSELVVSEGSRAKVIELSWDESVTPEVDYYNLYYSENKVEFTKMEIGNVTSFDFPIDSKNSDKEYYFKISGVNDKGEGPLSHISKAGYCAPKPDNFWVTYLGYNEDIKVFITPEEDEEVKANITSYKIYRDDLEILESNISDEIIEYLDNSITVGEEYSYTITAILNNGEETFSSDIKKGKAGSLDGLIPELNCSEGSSFDIEISCVSNVTFKEMIVYRASPKCNFQFEAKPNGTPSGSSTKPNDFLDSLNYKVNPNWTLGSDFVEAGVSDKVSFIDLEENTVAGPIKYKIKLINFDNSESEFSEVKEGYRKITNLEFLLEVNNQINRSQWKMTNIHQTGTTPANDEKNIQDDSSNGKVDYLGYVDVFSGTYGADIKYSNYCDYYLTFNDHNILGCQKTRVNSSGSSYSGSNNGLTGGLMISGIYSGFVEFHLDITNKKKSGGYYTVTQTGGSSENLDWDFEKDVVNAAISSME